jgi:hypothetical protein
MEAVQMWLAAAEISSGPVFRALARGGKVSDVPPTLGRICTASILVMQERD